MNWFLPFALRADFGSHEGEWPIRFEELVRKMWLGLGEIGIFECGREWEEEKGFKDGMKRRWEEQWRPRYKWMAVEYEGERGWVEIGVKSLFKMELADLSRGWP